MCVHRPSHSRKTLKKELAGEVRDLPRKTESPFPRNNMLPLHGGLLKKKWPESILDQNLFEFCYLL